MTFFAFQSKVDYESRIRAQIEDQEMRRAKEAEKLRQEKEEEKLKMKIKQAGLTKLKLDTMQELRCVGNYIVLEYNNVMLVDIKIV